MSWLGMRAGRVWLVATSLSLAACAGHEEDDPAAGFDGIAQPVTDGAAGDAGSLVMASDAAPADAAPIFPGTMPPVPDASLVTPRDAAAPARPDASASADAASPTPRTDAGSIDISSCMPPPAGASAVAVRAWTVLNQTRLAAGAGCMNMVPALNTSAQAHCDYRAMHRGNASCTADAHTEISGCAGFTGADVQAREIAAGYPRQLAYTEVALTYGNNPEMAIPGWLVTPYHRIPLLDPWTTDMGWGGATGCDVIDIGRGSIRPPDTTIVMFPYDGQTNVPTSFNGLEAPAPPKPATGWPSSYPVSIYAQRLMVSEHVLTKDGETTPLEHVWLDARSPEVSALRPYFTNTGLLYGAAFEPNTKYRVKMVGSFAGGALNVEWTFTTGARRTTPF